MSTILQTDKGKADAQLEDLTRSLQRTMAVFEKCNSPIDFEAHTQGLLGYARYIPLCSQPMQPDRFVTLREAVCVNPWLFYGNFFDIADKIDALKSVFPANTQADPLKSSLGNIGIATGFIRIAALGGEFNIGAIDDKIQVDGVRKKLEQWEDSVASYPPATQELWYETAATAHEFIFWKSMRGSVAAALRKKLAREEAGRTQKAVDAAVRDALNPPVF